MSAVCLFTLILCLYGTARTAAGKAETDGHGVVRRNVGEQVTIQCRSASNQDMLYLKKGLNEEEDIYFTDSNKSTINQKFTDRLQFHGKLPTVDILIKNLTLNDTGPYWCMYKSTDQKYELKTTRGSGSVLLVVTVPQCDQSQGDLPLILASVVICAGVLIVILVASLICIIIKNKRNKARRR
ncbi:uncharacterized protein LOC109201947 isoform X4 [Oreochromis niloticus]|uniref:uncharacterized protein LOC109201947 isoform X4 n=1 Tax=Oreochromis niloticus TaxID=8128 RepID=UPI000DF233C7|nr:uncharacterized protein LOC109201947 isoform X4 [Oreochromis niloticus]